MTESVIVEDPFTKKTRASEWGRFTRRSSFRRFVATGQGLGLASISEARASACVSIYSRMFVSLPFRTVMAKTQWSSNVLFVAMILPLAKPADNTVQAGETTLAAALSLDN